MATIAVAGRYLRRSIPPVSAQLNHSSTNCFFSCCRARLFSCRTDSSRTEFPGENAYDLLGVTETSSFAEIKASFRKLAKETHPDLADSKTDSTASHRFVQILAAYEILSNSEKRAHYDSYLLSQRRIMQKYYSGQGTRLSMYKSHDTTFKQMEVVEWLKWYRFAISDIVSENKVVVGTGYFDMLERDFYSAIRAAYYGPVIESMDLLPDRFEAEERSAYETHEVLHLVSGRDLFGMVCLVNEVPALSFARNEKLVSISSIASDVCPNIEDTTIHMSSDGVDEFGTPLTQSRHITDHTSDAYKDLELHISGRVVAVPTRVPPKSHCNGMQNEDAQDHIYVFLSSHEDPSMHASEQSFMDQSSVGGVGSRIPLGTITGLGTSPEEGSCFVYDSIGTKTHVIMKHRTLLV